MSSLVRAWLSWKSAKAVALMSALALTVGIGSTTAIYTVVNAVMLRPLPYKNGERFVALFGATTTDPKHYSSNTFDDLLAYQHETNSFDVFGWFRMNTFNLTAPGTPQHIDGVLVTPELAQGLGVSLIAGEWFHDDSGAVISEALWNRLGGDRSIIGKAMALNGHSYTVTGVMPGRFRLPIAGPYGDVRTDVWLYLDSHGRGQNPNEAAYFGYARLRPGETRAQAEAEVKRVAAEIAKRQPASHPSYTAKVDDLQELLSRDVRPALLLLFAAAGLLLLITCANVAGLLLVRSVSRARETAIRVALGAGTRQLAAQYFLEGLVVSLAGAAGGVLLSVGLVRIVVSLAAATIPRAEEVALDGTALLFALGAAFLASALSSLAPLWQAIRTPPNEILTDGVRASASGRSRRLSRSLVIAEIALAFALLAVSAALLDHLRNLGRTSPGFDPSHLLTFEVTLSDELTSNEQKRAVEETGLIRALEAIPGVSAAGFVNQLPLAGCCMSTSIYPEGRPASLDVSHRTSLMVVSPTYFQTMRIPLRAGRLLSDQDAHPNLLLTVINDSAARYYWPDRDPVGVFGRFLRPNGTRFQVIGVVGDVRNDGLQNPTVSEVYLLGSVVPTNPLVFVVRSTRAVESLLTDVRRAIQSVDGGGPMHKVANKVVFG
jgi:predicted permease